MAIDNFHQELQNAKPKKQQIEEEKKKQESQNDGAKNKKEETDGAKTSHDEYRLKRFQIFYALLDCPEFTKRIINCSTSGLKNSNYF